jgi:hypothetical protein
LEGRAEHSWKTSGREIDDQCDRTGIILRRHHKRRRHHRRRRAANQRDELATFLRLKAAED